VYGAGIIASGLLWLSLGEINHVLPHLFQKIFSGIVALFITLLLLVNFYLYKEFGQFVTPQMLQFIFDDPQYFVNYIQTYLLNVVGVFVIGVVVCWWWLWFPKIKPQQRTHPRRFIFVIVFPLLYLIVLNQLRLYTVEKKIPMDTSLAIAIKEISRKNYSVSLHPTTRWNVEPIVNEKNKWNIVVIVNESFGKKPLRCYGYKENPMPFLQHLIEREREHLFVFQSAFSNSGATQVSVPSLFTGVAPYEGSEKLHRMPMLWEWASAAGMKTIFVTSQRYGWVNFHQFLFSPLQPEIHLTAENIFAPIVNDLGQDDLLVVDTLCHLLQNVPKEKSFLAVYNSNVLHIPFQQTSSTLTVQPNFSTHYENALFLLDKVIEKIFVTLQETHRLENTIVIITSDHGEGNNLLHPIPRLYSYYDEIMSIPFFVCVPERWKEQYPQRMENLRRNETRNICNLDIIPTIVDVLNDGGESNHQLIQKLKGTSLLQNVDSERIILALNTNDIREWLPEGFGIFFGKKRFVFSDTEGSGYFDVTTDKDQLHNEWKNISDAEKNFIIDIIGENAQLGRIYRKGK
jgi:glucan phosphoethanolaminetransferase (alkaline phosphatase superfamily)